MRPVAVGDDGIEVQTRRAVHEVEETESARVETDTTRLVGNQLSYYRLSTIDRVDSQARLVEKRMMRRYLILLPLFIHAIFPLFFFTLPLPGFIHQFHIPI